MRSNTGISRNRKLAAVASVAGALSLAACNMAPSPTAALRSPPYLALNTASVSGPAFRQVGYFAEENGCVVFHNGMNADPMTPVFPAGQAALATDGQSWLGMLVNDQPVAMNEVYRVSGASADGGRGLPLAAPAPINCPSSYFVVQNVQRAIAGAAMPRFCSGVTLCRSFGV